MGALAELHEHIVETTLQGVWAIDADSVTTYVNQSMADMLGYARDELVGRSMFDLLGDERTRMALSRVSRHKHAISEVHDFVLRRKDGRSLCVRLTANAFCGESGTLAFVVETASRDDAGEREHLCRILDESLNEVYLFSECDLRFEYANRGALLNLGYSLEQMCSMTPLDIKPQYTLESFRAALGPLVDGHEQKLVFQTDHLRADKSRYPVEVHLQLVSYKRDRSFLAIIMDISEREESERIRRVNEARFRALIEHSLDMVLLTDAEGRLTFASPSMTTILGYAPEQLSAFGPLELLDLVAAEDRALVVSALAEVQTGGEAGPVEFRVRHKDGELLTLSAKGRNLLDNPAVAGLVVNARDVTAQRRLEEQLQQARRLESIGRLAGGIAHDFNNILTAILGSVSFLETNPSVGSSALPDVQEIGKAGERAAKLTAQLLAFARKRLVRPQHVNLGTIVRDQLHFLRRVLGEEVEISTRVPNDPWLILADPTQLEQVIVNLAVNARDAMPGGGRLTFELDNGVLDHNFAKQHAGVEPGPYVKLVVSDTGEGIAKDILPHIFEPFFTTKSVGVGTGLGLATVYGMVRQSGGHVWVCSEPGVGTTFTLYFPRYMGASEVVAGETKTEANRGSERLLVVEDDETVRRMTVRALTNAGYNVHSESSPGAAIAWTRAQDCRPQLLITDVVMPGMSGKELAERLCAAIPELPVLYVSGYSESIIGHRGVLEADVELLAKPFSPAQLRARVRSLLDRKAIEGEPLSGLRALGRLVD